MSLSQTKGARFGLALLGAGMMLTFSPALAQPGARPDPAGASDALSRNLRSLAENPRSLAALMGAGMAALQLGDAQAAITFFARAEEVAPNDGRVKMWIGSALVQLEQPRAALKFFGDATALGVAEADVARDRGLAFDISGEPRRAQRDYQLVLRRSADPEVTRRLALSLAISGEREKALELLEEQLLVQDHAGLRARAFVLALTGDAVGAGRATQAAMPGPQAAAMAPFLARLPSLSPAERALAVHFGHFPGDGRTSSPQTYVSLDSATQAGRPDSRQNALGQPRNPLPEPVSTVPRRRPGTDDSAGPTLSRSNRTQPATVQVPPASPPVRQSPSATSGAPAGPTRQDGPQTVRTADVRPLPSELNVRIVTPSLSRIEQVPPSSAPLPSVTASPTEGGSRLADVAALVYSLPDNAPPQTDSEAPPRGANAKAPTATPSSATQRSVRTAAAAPAKVRKAEPARPAEPSRIWVQIAGGADKSGLPREFARIKAKAPKLLGVRTAWTTPLNATNRLLVGPFASAREAQNLVNELGKLELSSFTWTSPAGQKIEKLPAK